MTHNGWTQRPDAHKESLIIISLCFLFKAAPGHLTKTTSEGKLISGIYVYAASTSERKTSQQRVFVIYKSVKPGLYISLWAHIEEKQQVDAFFSSINCCLWEKWQPEMELCSGNHLMFLYFVMEMGYTSQSVTLSSHLFLVDYLDPSSLNPFVILFPNSLVTNPCGFKLCKLCLWLSHVRGCCSQPRLIPSNYRSKEFDVICALLHSHMYVST